ncbi:MAG: hypothetical protein AAFQ51_12100 [Pseudomonadota bacterium]
MAPRPGRARLVRLPGAAVVQIVVDWRDYAALNDAIAAAMADVLGPPANALEHFEAPVQFLLSGAARPSDPEDPRIVTMDWALSTVADRSPDRYSVTAQSTGGLFRAITPDDARGLGWLSAEAFMARRSVQDWLRSPR